uniref:Adenylosuccinate synthetase n=1 Tax=Anthurium amnicola TaxID=1678845 RepID=A0A1D1Z5X5_9ARAE
MSDTRVTQQPQQHEEEIVQAEGQADGGSGGAPVAEEEGNGAATPGGHHPIEERRQPQQVPRGRDGRPRKVGWYKRKVICGAKHLFLSPLRRIKKLYSRRCRSAYYYYGDDPGGCCCRCFRPPPPISPPRLVNPNDPGGKSDLSPSSYGFVKFLIESNDFYAPQCNVHAEASPCPHKPGE